MGFQGLQESYQERGIDFADIYSYEFPPDVLKSRKNSAFDENMAFWGKQDGDIKPNLRSSWSYVYSEESLIDVNALTDDIELR